MGAHEQLQECVARVPFACPGCERGYHVDLDLMKLARLNRVAICGSCQHRFSVMVKFHAVEVDEAEPSAPPPSTTPPPTTTLPPITEPPPDEAPVSRPAPISVPSPRSNKPPVSEPPPPSKGRRQRTQPQGLSIPGGFQRRGPTAESEATTRPAMKAVTADEEAKASAAARTDPHIALPLDQLRVRRAPTRPEIPQAKPDSDAPPPSRKRRTTQDGVPEAPPIKKKTKVKTSIIVEVADASKKGAKPKRSVYNATQLTKPGIGIPKHVLEKHRQKD